MELAMNFAKAVPCHMRVHLCGRDRRMAEQFLNHAQIGAMFEEMGREAMAKHMRRDVPADPGPANTLFNS